MAPEPVHSVVVDAPVHLQPPSRVPLRGALALAVATTVALHAVLLVVLQPHAIAASRYATVATALFAAACAWLRGERVPLHERSMLRWVAMSLCLWGVAHLVATLLGPPNAASSLVVDPSDLIYVVAAFPLLLALSSTRETESHLSIFLLNCAQMGLAILLTWALLFLTPATPQGASSAMRTIYAAECALLVVLTTIRYFAWSSHEERRIIASILAFLAAYMPVELGMDYVTFRWNFQAGNFFDLLWSVPFCVAAGLALYLPLKNEERQSAQTERARVSLGSLSPLLLTAGVFALAAAVTVRFPVLALSSIFLLLVAQALEAGVLQRKYLAGQALLLERERDLLQVNSTLEKLSQLDPLTNLSNRRRFDAALDQAGRRALRQKKPISILIVDFDYFKDLNDQHGHSYGDLCLVSVARALGAQAKRPYDLVARYGGDEFYLLLPDTGANGAAAMADRIHAAIRSMELQNSASPVGGRFTVSVGAGVSDAEFRIGAAALVDLADRALLEAKKRGGGQTSIKTPVSGPELISGGAAT